MAIAFETTTRRAEAIFALVDTYLRDRSGPAAFAPPRGELAFSIVARNGVAVVGATPKLIVTRNESGYFLSFGRVQVTDSDGRTRVERIQHSAGIPDLYGIRIQSEFYQTVDFQLTLPALDPSTPIAVELVPGPHYPFRNVSSGSAWIGASQCASPPQRTGIGPTLLRGSLHDTAGSPVESTEITVQTRSNLGGWTALAAPARTNEIGDWVVVLPVSQQTMPVSIAIERAGLPTLQITGLCAIDGRETVVREAALRGSVQRDGVGVAGATIAVAGRPATVTSGSNGAWAYYFRLDDQLGARSTRVQVRATLPSGEQLITTTYTAPHATAIVPAFRFV